MEAGGHIPRHWGMTKGMLTYHLALRAPRDTEKARMHLEEGETLHVLHWEDGKSFLFDDMFNHEVWNESEDDRYILLIQIKRPCRFMGNLIQTIFLGAVRHSRFVTDIRKAIDREAKVRESGARKAGTPKPGLGQALRISSIAPATMAMCSAQLGLCQPGRRASCARWSGPRVAWSRIAARQPGPSSGSR
jgi:hypothetical protein